MSDLEIVTLLGQSANIVLKAAQVVLSFVALWPLSILIGWIFDSVLWPARLNFDKTPGCWPAAFISFVAYVVALVYKLSEQEPLGWPLPLHAFLLWGLAIVTFSWLWLLLAVAIVRGTWKGYAAVERRVGKRDVEDSPASDRATGSHELEDGLLERESSKDLEASTEC